MAENVLSAEPRDGIGKGVNRKLQAVLNGETADEANRPELVLDDAPDLMIPHAPRPIVEHH